MTEEDQVNQVNLTLASSQVTSAGETRTPEDK
jgi:hypothetical protein